MELILADWKQRKYGPGTAVQVELVGIDHGKFLSGTLLTEYDADNEFCEMPRIQLENGTIVEGPECRWIPDQESIRDQEV